MKIILNKYLSKNCVLINRPTTYPNEWIDFLQTKVALMSRYKKVETYNFNKHENSKTFASYVSPYGEFNKYEEEYMCAREMFNNIFLKSNISILCFHATRLTKEEIERIKFDGLKNFTLETYIENKIFNLYKDGYISQEEKDIITSNNMLISDQERANQICFSTGYKDISYNKYNKSGLFNLYNNYGGEITYFKHENTVLGEKLKDNSYACNVIFVLDLSKLSKLDILSLSNKIFDNFSSKKDILHISHSMNIFNTTIPIKDIILVDEKSKLIFKEKCY